MSPTLGEWFYNSFEYLPPWSLNVDDSKWDKEVVKAINLWNDKKITNDQLVEKIIKLKQKYGKKETEKANIHNPQF